jgi:hypothetical protein
MRSIPKVNSSDRMENSLRIYVSFFAQAFLGQPSVCVRCGRDFQDCQGGVRNELASNLLDERILRSWRVVSNQVKGVEAKA